MTTTAHTTCPGCSSAKPGGHYLCRGCWVTLPRASRTALNRKDDEAARRLSDLHEALRSGTPLHRIQVAP